MKKRKVGLLSLIGLAGGYLVLRYPLFSLHGMKDWPFVLFIVGTITISISGFVLGKKVIPVLTLVGYIVGFILGYIFQFDYGPDGLGLNSMWIIWTCVYLVTILIGFIAELYIKRKKN